ncbi:hypothetical protein [Streptomyces sp. NRRL S-455]|uniref:hypothetical protein n=1 Tax=Streptomyces sp. NRRL S-455 TaxID=1463908 RepID=UPI0004BEF5B6|nr:hypothetical protein [Streptomyces sp. NRRL S-455]
MNHIGQNHPDNPFSPAGRANGQTNGQLRARGLDGQGNPLPSNGSSAKTAGQKGFSRPGGTRGQGIAQLAQSIGSMELSNQDDLHAFCEAYRAILNYLAVSAKMAEGQLKAAARANARQAKDGWMTPAQAAKLALTLRSVGKDLDRMANSCVDGSASAVKAWRRFEGLLDELENDRKGVRRPGGRRGGSFTVV